MEGLLKTYLVSAEEMRALDRMTAEKVGIGYPVLMERAAFGVAQTVRELCPLSGNADCRVVVFAGCGNNGADAVAAGRMLALDGYDVHVFVIGSSRKDSDLMRQQLRIAKSYGLIAYRVTDMDHFMPTDSLTRPAQVVIDGLFGIGLTRPLAGIYLEAARRIGMLRDAGAKVVSVDMPSGIHTDTGEDLGGAVFADVTVTFNYRKRGQILYPGCLHAGEVRVADAGIRHRAVRQALFTPKVYTYRKEDAPFLFPKRLEAGHKGTFGKVLLLTGSKETGGAAILSALGALRAGAGMVKVVTHERNRTALLQSVPEALIRTYTDEEDVPDKAAFRQADRAFQDGFLEDLVWADAVVAGCGLSVSDDAMKRLLTAIKHFDGPVTLDADALNLIAKNAPLKKAAVSCGRRHEGALVLTPHLGELARLAGTDVSVCASERFAISQKIANEFHAAVICKDARSVVAFPAGDTWYLNTTGNAGMATAGSGDVLAGICGAFQAVQQDMNEHAAVAAACIHGLAGDLAADTLSARSMKAADIAGALALIRG